MLTKGLARVAVVLVGAVLTGLVLRSAAVTASNGAVLPSQSFTSGTRAFSQQQKLVADDDGSNDFGGSVDLSADGNTALVGAPRNTDDNGLATGAAYVFTRTGTTWIVQQKLVASDGGDSDRFGLSVLSEDGNTAFIGAPSYGFNSPTNPGAVYIFTRSGGIWTQQQKLIAVDDVDVDLFGISIAISVDGGTLLVGAPRNTVPIVDDSGAVYVFTRTGGVWTQQQKLIANDPVANDDDLFGNAVSLSPDGNTALIGAPYDGSFQGSAYIFTRAGGTWTQQQKLIPGDNQRSDYFGFFHVAC